MASLISSSSFACTFHYNKNYKNINSRQIKFSCKASTDRDVHESRRNILIGLAGTATALTQGSSAVASPIITPDISECHKTTAGRMPNQGCCPPAPPTKSDIVDFKPPPHNEPLKVRKPAHLVGRDYIEKYEKAVELMKALPLDDPRNFLQQANVHCAYCDGAYEFKGSDYRLLVHNSWLFFPWHRLYLYFHERILGKLIGDETFAIPFWNWDTPKGMTLPAIYAERSSPLYDCFRNATHLPPTIIDLNFNNQEDPKSPTSKQLIDQNLKLMHKQVIQCGPTAKTFLGEPYRSGEKPEPGAGVFENVPHAPVHRWTGDPTSEHNGDMGIFTLAARDPVFYAHHANIDRVWSVWKKLGGKRKDFDDPDWLESSFLFYDENKQLVRVKVKDSLQTEPLRYKYENVENLWIGTPPTRKATTTTYKSNLKSKKLAADTTTFPFTLSSSPITATIKRPKVSRNQSEKEEEEEILVVEKVEFSKDSYIKFDVYINTLEHEGVGPESSEFVGSFVNLGHKHDHKKGKVKETTTKLSFGINELLKDLEADDDESLLVTLVPRSGTVKIGGIKIEFDK